MQIGTDDPVDACICRIEDRNFPNQELLDALRLLKQIIDNILEHSDQEKYRRLNRNNPKLIEKLFKFKEIDFFLETLGFRNEGDFYNYVMEDFTMFALEKASMLLSNRIRNFKILAPMSEHPSYNLIKKRLDEKEEMDAYKKKLVEDFELNKKEIWQEKKWDPSKLNKIGGDPPQQQINSGQGN